MDSEKTEWVTYKSMGIHAGLFNKFGILAVKPKECNGFEVTSTSFRVGTVKIACQTTNPSEKSDTRRKLLEALTSNQSVSIGEACFGNVERNEEIFTPIIFHGMQSGEAGMHFYPWLSSDDSATFSEFSGFQQYFTTGGLFGPHLRGMDGDYSVIITSHNIDKKWKITSIDDSYKNNPYNEALFVQFENFCKWISVYNQKGYPKNLLYHLPSWDYLFFGVGHFIRGNMTLCALQEYCNAIYEEASRHKERLAEICSKYEITLCISSPFDNLFGDFFTVSKDVLLDTIWGTFEVEQKDLKVNEEAFVEVCIEKLISSQIKGMHRKAWSDFLSVSSERPRNLEDLTNLANSMMIAVASMEREDYKTCSLFPLSGRYVQNFHRDLSKKMTRNYPLVFNVTAIDPVLAYSRHSKEESVGVLFCFTHLCNVTVSEMITKKGLLAEARKNIARLIRGEQTSSLEETIGNLIRSKK